jgi:hypothetical protein
MISGSQWDHQPHQEVGRENFSVMAPSFAQQSWLREAMEMVLSH